MFKATGLVVEEEGGREGEAVALHWRRAVREEGEGAREGSEMCGNLHFGGRTGRKEAGMQRGVFFQCLQIKSQAGHTRIPVEVPND